MHPLYMSPIIYFFVSMYMLMLYEHCILVEGKILNVVRPVVERSKLKCDDEFHGFYTK